MFDRIVIRRTVPLAATNAFDWIDLGRLAESMLFYRKVDLVMSHGTFAQLLDKCGPQRLVELVEETNVSPSYIASDCAVQTLKIGANERYRPVLVGLCFEALRRMGGQKI
jgi:hypothetical protein